MTHSFTDFVHDLQFQDIPEATISFSRRCLLDLIGVAAIGQTTPMSKIIRQHTSSFFAAGDKGASMLFDSRRVSPLGAALAGGMTIDSMDAHDGYKIIKGHIGCGVLPALIAFSQAEQRFNDKEFLTALVIGYELGARTGMALHRTACDYHTSGAWVAVAVAALGARALQLNEQQTREAIGIAEYHGPRSQMMRAIDSPTMVKDGSGWGAMAGVSAAYLAAQGFTGAPAITVENDEVADLWSDLGDQWTINDQYFKPYPVCRWAQPPVEAALALCAEHQLSSNDIDHIDVVSFHEAKRLCTALPKNTEQAQYSLPFATAAAIVYGKLGPNEVSESAYNDIEVQRLSASVTIEEDDYYNSQFPAHRYARVTLVTRDGQRYASGTTESKGEPEAPLTDSEIRAKYHSFADVTLGKLRATDIEGAVDVLGDDAGKTSSVEPLFNLITSDID